VSNQSLLVEAGVRDSAQTVSDKPATGRPLVPPRRVHGAASVCRVAVVYDALRAWDLEVVSGIAAYVQADDRYLVSLKALGPRLPGVAAVAAWQANAIIAGLDRAEVARTVLASRLPVVGFGVGRLRTGPLAPAAYLSPNNQLVAKAAIDHLTDKGFRHLAYYESAGARSDWLNERRAATGAYSVERRLAVHVFTGADSGLDEEGRRRVLTRWLRGLPKPVGVITPSDEHGREVLDACLMAGLQVPDEVGVIGVDNDQVMCRLSRPALSSIDTGASRIGYAAAAALDALLAGDTTRGAAREIAPVGVIQRRATEALAGDDPVVVKAMAFIWDHSGTSIGVPDVVRAAAVSRSTLEIRFREVLNCTVRDAIRRAHLQRARRLMVETSLPLKQVAFESGFKTVQHLTRCFVGTFGQTPARYRRAMD
jgi:LacI family transcriptional regulator